MVGGLQVLWTQFMQGMYEVCGDGNALPHRVLLCSLLIDRSDDFFDTTMTYTCKPERLRAVNMRQSLLPYLVSIF